MKIIEGKGVTKRFGGLVAVNNVDFAIEEGLIYGLIGPNGSGKTTLFNVLSKVFPGDGGQFFFKGKDITNMPSHKICELGMGRTWQGSRIFSQLTVLENVIIGRHIRTKSGLIDALFRTPRYRREESGNVEKALELLKLVGLYERRDGLTTDLPYAAREEGVDEREGDNAHHLYGQPPEKCLRHRASTLRLRRESE